MLGKKPERKSYTAKDYAAPTMVRARYDIARSTPENANMWRHIDGLSAAAANDPATRKIIRERARYEVANNSYAFGIVDTLVADTIGPYITIQLGDDDFEQDAERSFNDWAEAVSLWQKVRTLVRSKIVDGEGFLMLATNPEIRDDIKLDIAPVECDRFESWRSFERDGEIDGIRFDAYNNPTGYRLLKVHPGDYRKAIKSGAGEWVNARHVIHYFANVRPGQVRGVSDLTPALSLFGELRLYTAAVLSCATRAAEITLLMETALPPDGVAASVDPRLVIQAERNGIVSLPEGWRGLQLKAEQPTTTYAMFKREIINEIARCLNMPYNIAACDSSSYNYASGRLDHQTYDRNIEVTRSAIVSEVLNRIYRAWLAEYAARNSLDANTTESLASPKWYFTSRGHVDPNKEASADAQRLANGTLTHEMYWARHGKDSAREIRQRIDERVKAERHWNETRAAEGLAPAPYPYDGVAASTAAATPEQKDDEPKDEGDEK